MDKSALRRGLSADLSQTFATRSKQGFQVPLGAWFRGPLRVRVADSFAASNGFLSRYSEEVAWVAAGRALEWQPQSGPLDLAAPGTGKLA